MAARATGFDGDEVARRLELAKHPTLEAARSSMAPIRHTDGDPALDYGGFLCPSR